MKNAFETHNSHSLRNSWHMDYITKSQSTENTDKLKRKTQNKHKHKHTDTRNNTWKQNPY